ncbi:MAG: response regulator transcription factor [Betaproteobacteria bacterium]|nr:response regulator transcription factor [Betaproteobacteria bacterium]
MNAILANLHPGITAGSTVFVVDDDAAIRDSLSLLLGLKGHRVQTFASAEDFLAVCDPAAPGCLLADVRLPGMDGLALQTALESHRITLPVIIITAHGDAAMARSAFKAAAVDFLEKPIDDAQLFAAVTNALAQDATQRRDAAAGAEMRDRLERLSRREREVMRLAATGRPNREIGEALGISPRTVEVYKARMMEKLQARNLSELVRIVVQFDKPEPAAAE